MQDVDIVNGHSRAYGFESKASVQLLLRSLTLDGGITRVGNAFFRDTSPRVYLDSAPCVVANADLTLSDYRDWTGSLRQRHTSNYRLDGEEDAGIRASKHNVLDLSLSKRVPLPRVDFNLSTDNLTKKRYFETQNIFESRLRPNDSIVSRTHGTPGYPLGVIAGLNISPVLCL